RSVPATAWAWGCSSPTSSYRPMAAGWRRSTAMAKCISRPGCRPARARPWARKPAPGPSEPGARLQQRHLQRFDHALAAHDLLELRAADRDVAFVAADLHLRPVLDGAPRSEEHTSELQSR